MNKAELEQYLSDTNARIIRMTRIGIKNGVDYAWRSRTRRRNLSITQTGLLQTLEYLKHEHRPLPSFCRATKPTSPAL